MQWKRVLSSCFLLGAVVSVRPVTKSKKKNREKELSQQLRILGNVANLLGANLGKIKALRAINQNNISEFHVNFGNRANEVKLILIELHKRNGINRN